MYSFFRSPSIVFGQPQTQVFTPFSSKYSPRTAAFVLESSPPMMTIASRSSLFATAMHLLNCSSVSSFVLPDWIMSKPPALR